MIISKRDLAVKLGNKEEVKIENVSIKLERIIKLWLTRKEIIIINNCYYLNKVV